MRQLLAVLAYASAQEGTPKETIAASIMDIPLDLMLIIVLLAGLCFQTLTIIYLYYRLRQHRGEEDLHAPGQASPDCCEHPDAVVVRLGPDGAVKRMSPGAVRFFGNRGKKALGRNLAGSLVPTRESSGRDLAALWHSLVRGQDEVQTLECECMVEGRRRTWMRWTVRRVEPLALEPGVAGRDLLCLGSEITGDRDRSQKLAMAFMAVEQTLEGVCMVELDGTILYSNQAWADMHGFADREELVGENMSLFHSPEQMMEQVIPFNREVVVQGSNQGEIGHVHRDGSPFICWMTSSLIRDAQGEPMGYMGIARDITTAKESETELKQALARMTSLLDSTEDLIAITDRNARPLVYNKPFADLILQGLGLEMRPGVRPTQVMEVEEKAFWEGCEQRALEGEVVRFEHEIVFPNGETRVYQMSLNPVFCDDQVTGFSLFGRKVSEAGPVARTKTVINR